MTADVYYIRDSSEMNCASCALPTLVHALKAEHQRGQVDPAGRALAYVRTIDPSDVEDIFADLIPRWRAHGRDLAALDLITDLCSLVPEREHSNAGEYCGGCERELVESWWTCHNCHEDNHGSDFEFFGPRNDDIGPGDYPTVAICNRCVGDLDTDGVEALDATVLLANDGRDYVLSAWDDQHGGAYTYVAGCRRFTMDQALEHWSNPGHRDQVAAGRLLGAVIAHGLHTGQIDRTALLSAIA